jgi:hypothetical protein
LLLLLLPVHRSVMVHTVDLLVRHPSDSHRHLGRRSRCRPEEEAVMWSDIAVITTDRQPEVMRPDVLSECRVETDPATVGAAYIDPGV